MDRRARLTGALKHSQMNVPAPPKPKFRVVIVSNSAKEIEKLLNDGYNLNNVAPHAKGLIAILTK